MIEKKLGQYTVSSMVAERTLAALSVCMSTSRGSLSGTLVFRLAERDAFMLISDRLAGIDPSHHLWTIPEMESLFGSKEATE